MELFRTKLKTMSNHQREKLAIAVRRFLLKHVSQTGGHLSSSLGATDAIVALHSVFDTDRDKIFFDVGHQSYAHKILTGRHKEFSTLRQWNGLSGFPNPAESTHDPAVAGHASTSISLALGTARAFCLQQSDGVPIAFIGDGALTGGQAYEALCDAGNSGLPMLVVLNDNGMAISRNNGGVAKHLTRLRTRPQYFKMKRAVHVVTDVMPPIVNRTIRGVKRTIRDSILPTGSLFESLGFTYLGPADGHNIAEMVALLNHARDLQRPVLLHLITRKGKGYLPAELKPASFHGVGAFDIETGRGTSLGRGESYSDRFGNTLCKLADSNKNLVAITAAMPDGTGLMPFMQRHPNRFFDVGIAEPHAVTMAAAMAKQGLRPVVAIYSTFLQRAFDQILHDVALESLPVVFCVDRAGLVGEDGATHHGAFDVGYLSQVPNMELYAPASLAELESMLTRILSEEQHNPIAIRYPRGSEGDYKLDLSSNDFMIRPATKAHIAEPTAIVTYGNMINIAIAAADEIGASIVKLNRLAPLDINAIQNVLPKRFAVIEDVVHAGSVGEKLAAPLAFNLGNTLPLHGFVAQQHKAAGLDVDSIIAALQEAWQV